VTSFLFGISNFIQVIFVLFNFMKDLKWKGDIK